MPLVLFDTSLYISALRLGVDAVPGLRRIAGKGPVWLSAVVLEELYAGTTTANRRGLERMEREFVKARRILIPELNDWVQTGTLLSRLGAKYGYEQIGRGRLTNDALIAMSAARRGITVITANARDFSKLAEFRSFHWRVETLSASGSDPGS